MADILADALNDIIARAQQALQGQPKAEHQLPQEEGPGLAFRLAPTKGLFGPQQWPINILFSPDDGSEAHQFHFGSASDPAALAKLPQTPGEGVHFNSLGVIFGTSDQSVLSTLVSAEGS